jgi:signal transduction histidine kinase/DNA-binding NarL/FixJ family response regulator
MISDATKITAALEENNILREEVRVARRASEITAELVVEQFVKTEKILKKLEHTARAEKQLRRKLAEKLKEAEIREQELAKERKRLEAMQIAAINMMEDMTHAQHAAEVANRAKSEFLANMSHEIRTPMNAILGFAELLSDEIKTPKHRQFLDTIAFSGKTLLSLINDILDLSKVEAGRLELNAETVDPSALLKDIYHIFSRKAQDKGLKFILDVDESLNGGIVIDEIRLRQILFNLVGNAVKFTSRGHVKLQARKLAAATVADRIDLAITVWDSGIGIPIDQMETIFEPFKQQDGQNYAQYGGSGLGLTITRRLVEMMNGSITVKSQEGKGSCFQVIFRQVQTSATPATAAPSQATNTSQDAQFTSATILIVDDIDSNRVLLKGYLGGTGLDIIEAADGKTAVQMALRHRPDLILMDMKLPRMSGYQATAAIKKNPGLKNCPVIALTASAMKNHLDKARGVGCQDLLTKPIDKRLLVRTIEKFIPLADTPTDKTPADAGAAYGSPATLDAMCLESLSAEARAALPELIARMEEELAPKWHRVHNTFFFQEIECFAEEINQLGRQFQIPHLQSWAGMLLQQSRHFDIEKLPETLNGFPLLLKKMQQFKQADS